MSYGVKILIIKKFTSQVKLKVYGIIVLFDPYSPHYFTTVVSFTRLVSSFDELEMLLHAS